MTDHASIWDDDYRRRGDLWGGAPAPLPDLPAGAAVLEVGCGNGKTLAALARLSGSVTAVDISPRAVALARRHPGTAGAGFTVGDARCLPFRDGAFDAVILVHVVGHLPGPGRRSAAAEVCRVLRPGGTAFFRDFSVEDMRAGKGAETEQQTFRRGDGIITHYFTEAEAAELFTPLAPVLVRTHRWQMRVRGRDLPRAEIEAVFRKMR
ncbi:class I SAM-dependent methyltransferase [Methanoculleus sp. Wushi-C6]|uniref:Class I SAM-dependent methyltransferase n=1 Tax=Methanoculleus caldifontis TaxID=2651577 RepID=A0ABU3X2I3_9EURY|nr:class I SAM-dependent methyltransferase [Methanoculleus sp. Wushi-C6]MDV2482258.1 class I SAM-dependent methyltransferase [Methanoculleus sp. Wushi-C6]